MWSWPLYNVAVRPIPALIFLLAFAFISTPSSAQDLGSPKFVVFGGAGVTNQAAVTRAGMQFGADIEEAVPAYHGHFPQGFLFEGGYAGPARDFAAGSALFSANYLGTFLMQKSKSQIFLPSFTGGYTRLFGTGNAINFGGSLDFVLSQKRALRFEARDYLRLSGPKEHNVALRFGYIFYIPD